MTATNPYWNLDTVLRHLKKHGCQVELDNDNQVILCTGLWEWPDRTLHTEPPDAER